MDNELQVILTEQNIVGNSAKSLIEAFGAPFIEAGDILRTYKEVVVTDESQTDVMAIAKEKRLTLKKIRTGVENKRKELKEESLKTGKAIDSVARYIKENIEPAEEYLELQEKFADIKKAERLAKIKTERVEKLMQYTDNISMYNIDGIEDETFELLLSRVKKEYDDKIAAEKAEFDRIEKERQEKEAEDRRVREENERLKKEAEAREIEIAKERKIEQEKLAKIEAQRQEELNSERKKLEEERNKREAMEAEQREKEQSELKAKQESEELERQALLAPDREKLISFANGLDMVRKDKLPAVKTKQAQDILNEVELKLSQLFNFINDKAKEL